ncbi:hypothetical protein Bca101_054763 [Brassica carinata]
MSSNGKSTLSGDSNSEKPKGVEADSFSGPIKPIGTPDVSSGLSISDPPSKKAKGEASVSSSSLTKPSGDTGVSSGVTIGVPNLKKLNGPIIQTAKTGVSSGVKCKAAVSYDVLFGLELLLIDQEGFIPAERIETYLPHMKAGGIYWFHNFFGSNNKTSYRVAEPSFTITFSSTSVLSDLEDSSVCFPEDRFRIHGYEEFDAACDLKGDLYDYVGHIKLVNGQVFNDILVLDESQIASTRRVLLHVQTHDGPVMKLNLWDKAASDFSERFKASGGTASVILVT